MNTKDPVCGMDVEPEKPPARATSRATTYYFCCDECKHKFDQNPQAFVEANAKGLRRQEMTASRPSGRT